MILRERGLKTHHSTKRIYFSFIVLRGFKKSSLRDRTSSSLWIVGIWKAHKLNIKWRLRVATMVHSGMQQWISQNKSAATTTRQNTGSRHHNMPEWSPDFIKLTAKTEGVGVVVMYLWSLWCRIFLGIMTHNYCSWIEKIEKSPTETVEIITEWMHITI